MMRPGPLYKRLGLTGPTNRLLQVRAGEMNLLDEVYSIRINRGGTDLSNYTASTVTIETPANVPPGRSGDDLQIFLTETAANMIADRVGEAGTQFQWRYRGRVAQLTSQDKQNRPRQPAAWRGTTVVGAAWPSLYEHAPDLFTPSPGGGTSLRWAAQQLFLPSWAPFATLEWRGDTEEWPAGPHDPIDAADLLRILSGRLYVLADTRTGHFRVEALDFMRDKANDTVNTAWPLARAHVLAPTTWDQPSTYPTEYRVTLLDPFGNLDVIITAPGGVPTGETRIVDQDWSDIVQTTEQWRRIHGLRWETFQTSWRLPSLDVRLDHLIASPYAAHRRAAGMLLRLNVGDLVPLAGDWPSALEGIHIVTSIEETITAHAWTMRLGLKDYRSLEGSSQLPVKPRTWAQAGNRTWADAGTATWNQGVPA